MSVEIERRFLVTQTDKLPKLGNGIVTTQCYPPIDEWLKLWPHDSNKLERILAGKHPSARIRLQNDLTILTLKGYSQTAERAEFETEIDGNNANLAIEIVNSGKYPTIKKIRYLWEQDDMTWEIDFFNGANAGLIIAEIELPSADHSINIPDWIDEEITGRDNVWSNHALAENPRPQ